MMDFSSPTEGLAALTCEDKDGNPDPIMSIVNQDSIAKYKNLLQSSDKATVYDNKLLIDETACKAATRKSWLYRFI